MYDHPLFSPPLTGKEEFLRSFSSEAVWSASKAYKQTWEEHKDLILLKDSKKKFGRETYIMYKSKLQELCHSKSWSLPEYIITKNGPDHCPNFVASITVNDILFQTQALVKSSKMAQNDVAKLALDYFSTVPSQQTTQPTIATTLLPPSQPLMPVPPQQPSLSLQQQHQETSCSILFPQPSMPTQCSHQPLIISPPGSLESTDVNDKLSGVSMSAQILKDKAQLTVNAMSSVLNVNDAHKGSLESTDVNDKLSGVPMSAQILKDKAQLTVVNAMSSVLNVDDAHKEPKRMYKHQLQHYAQKKNLKFPVYSCEREGPSHASRFKCDVTIDGKTYMSDDSFSTIKDAENEVARIALASLSQFGAPELIQDDSSCYKNMLQELTQKKKSNLPIYKTEKFGESHNPKFISTVEFEGEIFTGHASKTKKQAEMSAAEVAYHAMRKRKSDSLIVADTSRTESVHNLQLNMTNEPQHSVKPNASINLNSCLATPKQGSDCSSAGDGGSNFNCGGIQGALVSSSTVPICNLSSASEGTPSKRICIYPRTPNMTYPEDDVVLPMSDDKWVALSLSGNQNYSANV